MISPDLWVPLVLKSDVRTAASISLQQLLDIAAGASSPLPAGDVIPLFGVRDRETVLAISVSQLTALIAGGSSSLARDLRIPVYAPFEVPTGTIATIAGLAAAIGGGGIPPSNQSYDFRTPGNPFLALL